MFRLLTKMYLIYLIIFAGNTCFAQFKEIDPLEGALKGRVASVAFTSYKMIKTDTGAVKQFNDKWTYYYNSNGLLIEERTASEDERNPGQYKTHYIYDDKRHLLEVLEYETNGVLERKETFSFDTSKRLVEVRNLNVVTTKMLLNKAGNIIETTNYHHYPEPFSTFRYKYNRNGLRIESLQSWSKSSGLQKIVYEYDANHNLIKERVINDSKLLAINTYTYTKYDKMQNWLVQHIYRNGKLYGVTERSISYR